MNNMNLFIRLPVHDCNRSNTARSEGLYFRNGLRSRKTTSDMITKKIKRDSNTCVVTRKVSCQKTDKGVVIINKNFNAVVGVSRQS